MIEAGAANNGGGGPLAQAAAAVIGYDKVREIHAASVSQRAIARRLRMSIHTVRTFVSADQFPERATKRKLPSKLDPYLPYLCEQLAAVLGKYSGYRENTERLH